MLTKFDNFVVFSCPHSISSYTSSSSRSENVTHYHALAAEKDTLTHALGAVSMSQTLLSRTIKASAGENLQHESPLTAATVMLMAMSGEYMSATPSPGLGQHCNPGEMHVVLNGRLEFVLALPHDQCVPGNSLDQAGHHALGRDLDQ